MRRLTFWVVIGLPLMAVQGQPPTLEKVAVFGNTRTKTHVILREIKTKEGEPISQRLLLDDRAWLLRQDFLKRIEFQIKPGSTQKQRVLILVIQEKSAWSVSPILSNKDIFGWYAGARITRHNAWGRRNQIDVKVQLGSIQDFRLTYANPWLGGKLRLFTEVDVYQTSFRYKFRDYENDFIEHDMGVVWTLGRTLGRQVRVGTRACIERIWTDDSNVTLSGTHSDDLIQLEPFVCLDSRDWPLYPKTGFYLHSWLRWYAPFQNHRFRRAGIDFRLYTPAHHDNIIAFQASLQLSDGPVPVYKRLHLGGSHLLRGYKTDALAGENSLLISAEYRFPILYERNPLAGIHAGYTGVLFVDVGSAWFQHETFSPRMFRGSVGFGVHFIWDQWVLRAEYGNRGKGWGFINMGTGIKF